MPRRLLALGALLAIGALASRGAEPSSADKQHAATIAELDRVIAADPKNASAYDMRGQEHFWLRQFAAAAADWDRQVELEPEKGPGHWRRGIAYYYAGRYQDGVRQFTAYQNVDANDVENAVWAFLCQARASGLEQARKSLLPIKHDARVPMMEVYELFAGRATPDGVLAAAQVGSPSDKQLHERLFYAHLYLGLYYEALGDKSKTREHTQLAAEKYATPGYMGQVAQLHWQLLKRANDARNP